MGKVEIKVPSLGESITTSTIGQILKDNGSFVKEGDEILELETEKVNQVLFSPADGRLNLTVSPGDTVTVNQILGYIEEEKAPKEEPKKKEEIAPKNEEPAKPQEEKKPEAKKTAPPPEEKGNLRYKREAFFDDLEKPEKKKDEKKQAKETRKKMTKFRAVIAKKLVDSLHTSAMLTTFNEADMSKVMELRAKYKDIFQEKFEVKLGFMSFFVKAVVEALKLYPELNSSIDGDEIVTKETQDIGVAVGGGKKGLVVPVIKNADSLSFAEIEKEIVRFATKAKEGTLSIEDLQGGTFTITNGGIYGSLLSTPILNPPQSGILGMHQIQKRAVVVDDEIVIRPMMYLALSYDHRLVDGKEAVSFLVHVKKVLEDPSILTLLPEKSHDI